MQLIVDIFFASINVIDAGVEIQEINETVKLNNTVEAETGINDKPDEVSSGLTSSSVSPATELTSSNAQGTTEGEG